MLTRIEARSGVLEEQTARFDTQMAETLRSAEERARGIASSLSDAAQSAGASVTGAFEGLRKDAGSEGERTATAVRTAISGASEQMMTVFESAAGRFGDSVAGMREMAAEIRRELEATRADLQRGVLEIPRETQEATSEMRRVVSDQIKALNELSSLVSRSRRSVDVTEAVAPAPRKADVQPAKQQDVQVSEAAPAKPKQNGANPVAAPVAAKPSEPKAREDKSSDARPTQQMTIVSAPAARAGNQPALRPGETARAGAPSGRDNRGWLSDLLTRASLDDDTDGADPANAAAGPNGQAKPDATKAGSNKAEPAKAGSAKLEAGKGAAVDRSRTALETISNDIAKMIEHQTAVELWERYRRGEPNLFDRRLYTAQGRQTFEEIRRRYAADAEFRRTVDRYVGEFERLLGEVSKNDRDSRRADAYLTSETGKVYTMLAHASGRFEGA